RIVAALRAPGGRIVAQVREIVKAAPGGEEALSADAPGGEAAPAADVPGGEAAPAADVPPAEAPESKDTAGGAEEPPAPEQAAGA
ncbi:MAG: hypothetical protein IMZ55_17945, partial [Acidobacteria bacterium]|nr:hypothetical protein [Acidobacteriota bacterium]